MDISLYLPRAARYWPERPALRFGDDRVSFRELDRRSNQLAHALLGLGLAHGDRVAVQSANRPEMVEVECALYRAALVRVPVNARLTPVEVQQVLADSGAKAFLASRAHVQALAQAGHVPGAPALQVCFDGGCEGWQDYASLLSAASDRMPDIARCSADIAVLHYTSGSSGRLKAAVQTYGNRHASLRNLLLGKAGPMPGPGDTLALVGPMSHATGMLIQPFLSRGATLSIFAKFDPEEFLHAVARQHITHVFMVPTMINMLLSAPTLDSHDLSSLKSLAYGAAPMSMQRISEAWERIGPVLSQGYGAGETTGGIVHFSSEEHRQALRDDPQRLLACGRPFGEARVQVLGEGGEPVRGDGIGEIVVSGASVFAGYWNAPELTAECLKAGRWYSGDLARVDDEGFIHIVDRKKDMIISGGYNVYTTEVEQALYQHPEVLEACAYGVPDDKWGEAVRASVVTTAGSLLTARELIQFCADRLADFKKPRDVEFLPALPKNQNGKVARKTLRDRHWPAGSRQVN